MTENAQHEPQEPWFLTGFKTLDFRQSTSVGIFTEDYWDGVNKASDLEMAGRFLIRILSKYFYEYF